MRHCFALLVLCLIAVSGWAQSGNSERDVISVQPPMLGVHWARGVKHARPSSKVNLLYHGGAILPTTVTGTIFWGTSWSNASFVGDKITGLDSWYAGVGGSDFARTCDEYSDSTNAFVTKNISYGGHLIDLSAAPAHAPQTSTILNEVCSALAGNGVTPVSNGYYMVYVDTPRGHTSYCAWHSWGSCTTSSGPVPIQFGFSFNLDGDAGCDPDDTQTNHSQGLAALANVTGHEVSETRTDPTGSAWYDSSGEENADKCAWSFSGSLAKIGNTSWKLQGNWSNAAYNAGTGYPNRSGQTGCIDGTTAAPAVAP